MVERNGWSVAAARLNLTLLGAVVLVAAYWLTDRAVQVQPPAPELPATRAEEPVTGPRVFVYLIDSLRYETAANPAIMPNLAALRAEGVSAQVDSGYNAVTAVGVRDAFTGRENTSMLASISNFIHVDARVESLFTQLAQAGRTSAVYGKGDFVQFGAAIGHQENVPLRVSPERIDAHMRAAFVRFLEGRENLVVGHLTYTDDSAHALAAQGPDYEAAFRRADAHIAEFRRALPSGATLVVLSDHGHDERGRHGLGMKVPSMAVYVGPAFRPGVDLGTIPITAQRYLLSGIFGLTVPGAGYTGGEHAVGFLDPSRAPAITRDASPATAVRPLAFWFYAGLLAALWVSLVAWPAGPLDFRGARALWLWLAVLPLGWLGAGQAWLGIAAALAVIAVLGRNAPAATLTRWVGGLLAAALFFHVWGRLELLWLPTLNRVTHRELAIFWLVVACTGAIFVTPANRDRWTLGLLIGAGLLAWPTHLRFGFPGLVAPLLGCWYVWLVAARAKAGAWSARERGWLVAGALALLAGLQTVAGIDAAKGTFTGWVPLIDGLGRENIIWMTGLGLAAKLVLFFPRRPDARALVAGLVAIAVLHLLEWRLWQPGNVIWVALLTSTSALAWWTRRERTSDRDVWVLATWFLLCTYFIMPSRVPDRAVFTVMMAALVIGARAAMQRPAENRGDYVFLATMGLMITGWAALKWSVQFLEWERAYSWFSAPYVQERAIWFVPWIVLKTIVPFLLIRRLLRTEFGAAAFPAHAVMVGLAVKAASLFMVNTGLGAGGTLHQPYLECAEHVGVIVILFTGLVWLRDIWPGPSLRTKGGRRA